MNKIAIGTISGIGGGVIGAGVTYFFLKKHYDKVYEKEIADTKEYYMKKLDELTYEDEASQYQEEGLVSEKSKGDKVTITDNYDSQHIIETLNYRTLHGDDGTAKASFDNKDVDIEGLPEDAEFAEDELASSMEEDIYSDVWVITDEEYEDTEDEESKGYEKVEYAYLPSDDVLIDSDGTVLADDLETYRQFLDHDVDENDNVYVRDSKLMMDIKISVDNRDYGRYVEEELID